jgi:UDP-N-acetylmuramate dehydrogenase
MFLDMHGVSRYNVLMSKITWFNVGGPAERLYKPKDTDNLSYVIRNTELPINIIGATSNIIIRDCGIKGTTIKLGKEFAYIKRKDNHSIIAGGAVLLSSLARFAAECEISGFEFLIGIPGTVGGSVEMNAGAYGSDISSIIQSIKAVDLSDGNLYIFSNEEMRYSYRKHNLQGKWIFVEAEFRGIQSERVLINKRTAKILNQKNTSQPTIGKTAGCVFKNLEAYKAWELIDAAGCRGLCLGGAKISEQHCNFLLNYNNATASDLENLGNKVQKIVKDKFNIELEWEIRILG